MALDTDRTATHWHSCSTPDPLQRGRGGHLPTKTINQMHNCLSLPAPSERAHAARLSLRRLNQRLSAGWGVGRDALSSAIRCPWPRTPDGILQGIKGKSMLESGNGPGNLTSPHLPQHHRAQCVVHGTSCSTARAWEAPSAPCPARRYRTPSTPSRRALACCAVCWSSSSAPQCWRTATPAQQW